MVAAPRTPPSAAHHCMRSRRHPSIHQSRTLNPHVCQYLLRETIGLPLGSGPTARVVEPTFARELLCRRRQDARELRVDDEQDPEIAQILNEGYNLLPYVPSFVATSRRHCAPSGLLQDYQHLATPTF